MQNKKDILILNYCSNQEGLQQTEDFLQGRYSSFASSRIQLKPAIEAALDLGLTPRILSLNATNPKTIDQIGNPKLCLIGKFTSTSEEDFKNLVMANLAAITRLKRRRAAITLIYSDNSIANPSQLSDVSEFYKDLLFLADQVITPSRTMADLLINAGHQKTTTVIEDCWSVQRIEYSKLEGNEPLKVLWFGSSTNARFLTDQLPSLIQKTRTDRNIELTVLGAIYTLKEARDCFKSCAGKSSKWGLRLTQWNKNNQPYQLEKELKRAHVTFLPSNPDDALKAGVSHNRLVDSIRGGCIPIASPMESYKDLSRLSILTDNFAESFSKIDANYDRLTKKYSHFRDQLIAKFSPEANKSRWLAALTSQIAHHQ